MTRQYQPDAGDIVWLQFNPQSGHEQTGHRPALVLSPVAYNKRSGLMLCCSMTTRVKGYPFEVELPGESESAILADQIKSFDWRARRARYKAKVSGSVLREVRAKVVALVNG